MATEDPIASTMAPLPEDEEPVSWESLGLCRELLVAVKEFNWGAPTAIQKAALPYALAGRDIIGLAETGSGKTATFAIPILQALLDRPARMYALVLAPTRELCIQIGDQFKALGASIDLTVCVLVGGTDRVQEVMLLSRRPHVIVAAPGKLIDHLTNTRGFSLETIRYLVMDEADRLLSMDFDEALNTIIERLPPDRKTYLFSATMTDRVSELQRAALKKPVKVEVNTSFDTVSNLNQSYKLVPHQEKNAFAARLLKHYSAHSAMVFTNTCATATILGKFLEKLGFEAVVLHGKMDQRERLSALRAFRSNFKKILVATEVGSRGLDIPQVDLVLNYDVPLSSKDYIHRVGRTARAGRAGRAVSIVTQYDVVAFQAIEKRIQKTLEEFDKLDKKEWKSMHDRAVETWREAELDVAETKERRQKHYQFKKTRGAPKGRR